MPAESPLVEDSSQLEPRQSSPFGRVNIFFRLAAGMVVLFVITIFALIAVLFGDPAAPIAKWLDRIGMQLIVGEMCAILIVGTLAMTVDRRADSRRLAPRDESPSRDV